MTLTVPEQMTALSNMPVRQETRSEPGWKTVSYEKTPVTSTYLLAVVVAEGDLRVVADFEPDVAVGVIRPGQKAQLRLAAFPWTQYGTVPATVRELGTETSSDHVRVELTIDARERSDIPLQHGLSTAVDIEVARVSPAALLLRSIGARLQNGGPDDSLTIAPRDELLADRNPDQR